MPPQRLPRPPPGGRL